MQTAIKEKPAPAEIFETDDQRWQAVLDRRQSADGRFFLGVATTGIYCYPSCGARTPNRENVSFYESREAAVSAGFRACKRCKSDLPPRQLRQAEAVASACRLIEESEFEPNLAELAEAAGLSPRHLHHCFKEITGVTPKKYATMRRVQKVQEELAGTVTEAIYAAGYNSSARFYEGAKPLLGMKPSAYAKGGAGETIRWALAPSSLGMIMIAATEAGICSLLFIDDRADAIDELTRRFPRAMIEEADDGSDFTAWVSAAVRAVDDPTKKTDLPLVVAGTAFQQKVWSALREIPSGETASYKEIAQRIGRPKSVRAVANACGANPLAIVIPCHRVVASDGALGGYRWGVERKQALLAREAAE